VAATREHVEVVVVELGLCEPPDERAGEDEPRP
jgi:hypothetical protein